MMFYGSNMATIQKSIEKRKVKNLNIKLEKKFRITAGSNNCF
jgi:hypothetical protein